MDNITNTVSWIGVNAPDSRDFHGIATPRGGSYNSYLIRAEKPAIIDGTNTPYLEQYMRSLSSMIDPAAIRYIIINHVEPDHTGALPKLLLSCPDARIVCTPKAQEFLAAQYGIDREFIPIDGLKELDLGNMKLRFMPDPMVHWPETMMTYLVDEKMLFSADLFGTEISHEHIFADEYEDYGRLLLYYFAIVMRPVSATVKAAIDKVRQMDLNYIAPSHGPVYRNNLHEIIDVYEMLATKPEQDKVFIAYASIWHGTQKMAEKIAEGVRQAGSEAVVYDALASNHVEMMAEAMISKAIAVGSLTIVGNYHPALDTLFGFLKLNNQKGKKMAVFGSHGWYPAAVPKLADKADDLGYELVDLINARFGRFDPDKLTELGKKLAQ